MNRRCDQAFTRPDRIFATEPRKAYAEGHSKLEAIRCLKRYIAREIFSLISQRRQEINQAQIAT